MSATANAHKKILVTGGSGLLAYWINRLAGTNQDVVLLSHSDFDLTSPASMEKRISELVPDVVINTASYNAVDRAEQERELSWEVNAVGPTRLAEICAARAITLVHYGTDYVFDGAQLAPYVETDEPNPINHYGDGKLAGERGVLEASSSHLVMRTSWLFGPHPTQSKSFVHTVLGAASERGEVKAAVDQKSVPTFAPDLGQWTLDLLARGATGLVHAVNDGGVSRYDWARAIIAEAGRAGFLASVPKVEAVPSSTFSTSIRRPACSVMSNEKLSRLLGGHPGSWLGGLEQTVADNFSRAERSRSGNTGSTPQTRP